MSDARNMLAEFIARASGWPGRGDKFTVAAAVMEDELRKVGLVQVPDAMTLAREIARGYEKDASPNGHDYRAAERLKEFLETRTQVVAENTNKEVR